MHLVKVITFLCDFYLVDDNKCEKKSHRLALKDGKEQYLETRNFIEACNLPEYPSKRAFHEQTLLIYSSDYVKI